MHDRPILEILGKVIRVLSEGLEIQIFQRLFTLIAGFFNGEGRKQKDWPGFVHNFLNVRPAMDLSSPVRHSDIPYNWYFVIMQTAHPCQWTQPLQLFFSVPYFGNWIAYRKMNTKRSSDERMGIEVRTEGEIESALKKQLPDLLDRLFLTLSLLQPVLRSG